MSKCDRIYLLGFMGVGKTTIGKALAKETHRIFLDTDDLVEKKAGKNIAAIFKEDGKLFFRQLEREVLEETLLMKNVIVATGGGLPAYADNLKLIKEGSYTITLTASVKEILFRVKNSSIVRPLLDVDNKEEYIINLMKKRAYYYILSDMLINTTDMFVSDIVNNIIKELDLKK